jgi:tetratricopeptide (TPR) repeat protein
MKSNRRSSSAKSAAAPRTAAVRPAGVRPWHYLLGGLAVLILAFEIYQPAIRGPFLFDDRYLPFFMPGLSTAPLKAWIIGVRPMLMFTFWVNYQIGQTDPYWYHVFNVFFHAGNAVLIGLIVERILLWAGVAMPVRRILAIFGGLLFLAHPVQTESVAYVASRSENLSVLLFNGAFVVFLYRRSLAVSVRVAAAVLILFIAACVTKEHAAVLPALLLLTDYFWNPGFSLEGIRRNWKLYLPIAGGAVLAGIWVARVLRAATTAGFGLKDLPWYEYFFSQCRAIWVYIRLFFLPYGQNVDHEFAVSKTVFDHGAIAGLAALLAVSAAAWIYRRKFPLAAYGWFVFLVLLAPTSSFVPIRDLLVERRLYLPFPGLILICCEFLRRWRVSRTALAAALGAVVAVFAFAAYQRNEVWSDPVALWKDTAEKSPHKSRPRFQLAYAYYTQSQCVEAAAEYEKASKLETPEYSLFVDWALALDCAQKPEAALEALQHAVALEKSAHAYALIGMIYAKQNKSAEALDALNQAEVLNPRFEPTYVYRGNVHLLSSRFDEAARDFRSALALNPGDTAARNGLDMAERRVTPRL